MFLLGVCLSFSSHASRRIARPPSKFRLRLSRESHYSPVPDADWGYHRKFNSSWNLLNNFPTKSSRVSSHFFYSILKWVGLMCGPYTIGKQLLENSVLIKRHMVISFHENRSCKVQSPFWYNFYNCSMLNNTKRQKKKLCVFRFCKRAVWPHLKGSFTSSVCVCVSHWHQWWMKTLSTLHYTFFCIFQCRKRLHPSLVSVGDANANAWCKRALKPLLLNTVKHGINPCQARPTCFTNRSKSTKQTDLADCLCLRPLGLADLSRMDLIWSVIVSNHFLYS